MLNTCFETTKDYHAIAYYSHLIPVAIALLLGFFVLQRSKYSLLSKIFFSFILGFSLWLLADVVIWTNNSYYLITALWAPLDFINILFYLLSAYFFIVLIRSKDVPGWAMLVLTALALPAWWITFNGGSIVDFYQPVCEATNNDWLTKYKLIIEVAVLAFIMFAGLIGFMKSDRQKRRQIVTVAIALILFLSIFASTEYIASMTGVYEINLYSLFVLPIFLAIIIFSITNLRIFAYRSFGLQLLIYVLLIMVGSQFFLLENTTYKALTLVTFALSLFLGIVLARNLRREEELAIELEKANEGQATLIHFINHQIKGYLSKARDIFSELLTEPSYGPVTEPAKKMISTGETSVKEGVDFVQQILRASDIEKGTMAYNMRPLDFKRLVIATAAEIKPQALDKGLDFKLDIEGENFNLEGDENQLREAVKNLIDNAIKYTPSGSINLLLSVKDGKILFSVKDTGIGFDEKLKSKLFTKGGRGEDSLKINVNSTGYGLAIVRGIVETHKGKVWAESAGIGKGSTFYMELPLPM